MKGARRASVAKDMASDSGSAKLAALARRTRILALVLLVACLPLAGMAFLKLGRAVHRQKLAGYTHRCRENLAQLGATARQYAADWDDRLPPSDTWADALSEQMGDRTAFACPADPTHAATSYALNAGACAGGLGSILEPTMTPLLYDSDRRLWNARDPSPTLCNPPRHQGANNVLFADGSVRAIRAGEPLGEAAWAREGISEDLEVDVLPPWSGPTLLLDAGGRLGLRTERPAEWTLTREAALVRFADPEDDSIRVELRRGADVSTDPSAGVPTEVTVLRRFRVDVSRSRDFPLVAEGIEVRSGRLRKVRIAIPSEPPTLYTAAAPEERWESLRPALLLPLAALEIRVAESAESGG